MKKTTLLLILCTISLLANATVYINETFNYTDGNLAGQGSWTEAGSLVGGTGRTISSPALSYNNGDLSFINSGIGKAMTCVIGTSAADYYGYKPFTASSVNSGIVYLSFLLKVNANISSTNQEAFGLSDGTSSGPKVLIGKTAAGFYKIGTVRASTTSADYQYNANPTSLTVGTSYFLVLKYDFSTSTSSVYINPTLDGAEPATPEISDGASKPASIRTKLSNLWCRQQGTLVTNTSIGGARVSSTWAEAVASTAYVPPVSNALTAPTNGAATDLGSSGFTANWTPNTNAIGYTVKVYWGTTFVDSTNISGQSASSVAVSKLVPGLTYTYQVIARGNGVAYTDSELSTSAAAFTLLSAAIPANTLKIILKLDDLGVLNSVFAAAPVWDYLSSNKIKWGAGAIANRFDNTSLPILSPYLNTVNEVGDTLIEVWNHGYDHSNPSTGLYEFSGASYADQKTHFENATTTVKNILGVQMHTFGTPYNASDVNTNLVISENQNYKVMMFSDVKSTTNGITYLDNRVNMETVTGNADYSYFVANYNSSKITIKDYMILQGHPNYYTVGTKLDQLKLIVKFLISEGVEFVRPYDYYRSLTLTAPTSLNAIPVSSARIDLSWTDNSATESNFKIERSTNGTNWTFIGTSPANTSTYSDTNVPGKGTYYYRIYASCGIKSDYSNVKVTNNLSTGNSELSNPTDFKINVFPNPCTDKATVQFALSAADKVYCNIYNATGKLQLQVPESQLPAGNSHFSIDVSKLQSGIYFCQLITSTNKSIEKLTIIK